MVVKHPIKPIRSFPLYNGNLQGGACLNRLGNILSQLEQATHNEDKAPLLMHGAIELRFAIESTIKLLAFNLSGKHLKNFSNAWRKKRLKQILLDHDEKFFSMVDVGAWVAKYDLAKDPIVPNFDALDKIKGRNDDLLHFKRFYDKEDEFDKWVETSEKNLRKNSAYMINLYSPTPKEHVVKVTTSKKGQWLVDQYHSKRMDKADVIEYIKANRNTLDSNEEGLRKVTHVTVSSTSDQDQELVWFELKYQEPTDTQPVHQARFAVTPEQAIEIGNSLIDSGGPLL